MPKILRRDVDELNINKGVELFAGRGRQVMVHTGYSEQIYEKRYGHILDETMMHEAAHTSMDAQIILTKKWADAVQEDGKYISNYARDHPLRESVAETYVVWFATRCMKSKFRPGTLEKWEKEMGAQFRVLDEESLGGNNMSPYTDCSPP